jgi:invasion protein IalB
MKLHLSASALFAGALLAAAAAPVMAADTKDAPPPVPAEPQNTSATYGDWVLRCALQQNGSHVCELAQPFQIQGQQGLYAQMLLSRGDAKGSLRVTFEMAPNVSFPSTVKIGVDDKDTTPVELTWRRCLPSVGCFADADLKDDVVKKWRAQTGSGRILFKDAAGRDQPITFSFRGLPQGLDGLLK